MKATPLKKRLPAYSAAAGAVLAMTPAAQATVHNIADPGVSFDFNNQSNLNQLINAGPFEVKFHGNAPVSPSDLGQAWFSAFGSVKFAKTGFSSTVLNLDKSATFASRDFGAFGMLANKTHFGGGNAGQFLPNGASAARSGYIALRAGAGSTVKYGWLKVSVQNGADGRPSKFSFLPSADDSQVFGAWVLASDPDAASFTTGTVAVPEPASLSVGLGLLALGAAGVREWRRRRATVATAG